MIEEIVDLQPLVGGSLNVPLSEQMLADLNSLISTAEAQCTTLAQEYINKAWNEGQTFVNSFLHEEKVKTLKESLNLFADNDLLKGIRQRRDDVQNFIQEADTRINEAKEFHLMSEKEVRILKVLDELFIIRSQNDFGELAQKMIHTQ